jgi:hypothetical protein
MCTNLNVSGFGMNGGVPGTTNASSSLLEVGLVDHFATNDMYVDTYYTDALCFVNTRNLTVTNANINNAVATGPGQGYGVTLERCRYVTVKSCTANNMQQGVICHSGTTDASISYCTMTGCSCDMHGMDERRITWTDNTCTGSIQVGNQAWPEGDMNVTITGGSYGEGLNLCAYANTVSASNVNFSTLNLWSTLAGVTNPAANQYADKITLTSCTFTGPHDIIKECPALGNVTFNKCTLISTQTAWGIVVQIKSMTAKSLNFTNCNFEDDSGYIPMVLSTSAAFSTSVSGCTFTSQGGSPYAVQLQSTFVGTAKFSNNSFTSAGAKAFMQNESASPNVLSSNNSYAL